MLAPHPAAKGPTVAIGGRPAGANLRHSLRCHAISMRTTDVNAAMLEATVRSSPLAFPAGDPAAGEVTALLRAWQEGDRGAADRLVPLVLGELRKIAAGYLAIERRDHTLQPTALVHEAYLRLVDQEKPWKTRSHFFAIAAQMIRRILTDHARRTRSAKRGRGLLVSLDEAGDLAIERPEALLDLESALAGLAQLDSLKARIVEYRYFGGLTGEEIAEVEGLSPATVQRHWQLARAWLFRELKSGHRADA